MIELTDEEYAALKSIGRCEGCFTGQWPSQVTDKLKSLGLVEFRFEGPAALFGLSRIYLTQSGKGLRMAHPVICPHCKHPLTDAEVRALWASRNGKRQTPHAGPGRPKKKPATDDTPRK